MHLQIALDWEPKGPRRTPVPLGPKDLALRVILKTKNAQLASRLMRIYLSENIAQHIALHKIINIVGALYVARKDFSCVSRDPWCHGHVPA